MRSRRTSARSSRASALDGPERRRFMTAPKPGRFDLATVKELNRLARKWGLVSMPGDGAMGVGGECRWAAGRRSGGEQEAEYNVVGEYKAEGQLSEGVGASGAVQAA